MEDAPPTRPVRQPQQQRGVPANLIIDWMKEHEPGILVRASKAIEAREIRFAEMMAEPGDD